MSSRTAGGSAETPISELVNRAALEPLFKPWEEPNAHRVKSQAGGPAERKQGRRPSSIAIAQNLRGEVRQWRDSYYAGASDTSRHLLDHWFGRSHRQEAPSGEEFEFRYYFCQREAMESLIFLKEVRKIERLSQLVAEFGGDDRETAALGITEEEDVWSRYAFKMATGSGKTKVMSLAVVWSYFHALRESESEMARHFVIIAPNLTVYERLKEDFGDGRIFDRDPLIPPEWRGDWNLSVILQDEAGGAVNGGALYLTNIHRLHDPARRRGRRDAETYDWMGPAVSRAGALDTSAALRERITAHGRILVLNDEAHHVWDPDSAWNEAIRSLHEGLRRRGESGLVAQLDFSATPKDQAGQPFKHIVCDTPLGEAVDSGIIKTPILGSSKKRLETGADDNAAYKFDRHLRLGYARWKKSKEEWAQSGKKPLLFIMCEDTQSSDQIAHRLNTDPTFVELHGKTINLHTNLKGKVKKVGSGPRTRYEFHENESEINDEDLRILRQLSRELDQNASPYQCIVSVLMLREGWDVRNVTTIVPLRPLNSKAEILPEQTLGRGLRRMTPPGQAHETVTVVEHPAFASLYAQELAQEGVPIEVMDVERIPSTTVSIYPDVGRKDVGKLEMLIPVLAPGYRPVPKIENLAIDDVKKEFEKYKPLPLAGKGTSDIDYEGRHLVTGEIVEKSKIHLPLLGSGAGAVSYYVKQLELVCRLRGSHATLAPLVQAFLEGILFERKTDLYDPALLARLGESDVVEHVRAVFLPLIRARVTKVQKRSAASSPLALSRWKAFQVTHNENRPALPAARTLFNLVPCNRELEAALAQFADRASGVTAFAKNAGPQCLRIDYLAAGGRPAFYTPDFFVRTTPERYFLVETKGREDADVPRKARAAIAWCESASTGSMNWEYLYIPQGVFERLSGDSWDVLVRTCTPALQELIRQEGPQLALPHFAQGAEEEERRPDVESFVEKAVLVGLPSRYRKAAEQAVTLYRFMERKEGMNFAPVFGALLGCVDEAARGVLLRRLQPDLPPAPQDQKLWFEPRLDRIDRRFIVHYEQMARNLKKTLAFNNGVSPLGLLRACLEYALTENRDLGGVFSSIKARLRGQGARALLETVSRVNEFRNRYVAHHGRDLTDPAQARIELAVWIAAFGPMGKA